MGEEGAAEPTWDQTLEEWLISEGNCYAAGLAQLGEESETQSEWYAAAPQADEAGWGFIYAEECERDLLQEDGVTTKKVKIIEAEGVKTVALGKRPATGLWIAGEKWQITQQTTEDVGDTECRVTMAQLPKKGLCLACSKTQVILGMYSEEQNQTAGMCKKAVLAFVEYLIGQDY